ncbi:MAG: CARDB domain-containing protein [Candidatus Poseidoniaceae archaeon]
MTHLVSNDINALEDVTSVEQSSGTTGFTDVPSWRIGDKWTYETQFDVAQLIAQANVSASLNTLTGDTVYEVEDIFFISVDGIQTLAYKLKIEGAFSSGNSGATLEGVSGRLNIDYDGEDIIRVRDLAVINSEFELDVDFAPFNLGFLTQNIATINFDTYYDPPKERYDFPLRTGDQWYMPFMSGTSVSGSSDFFDPSEFDTNGAENNSWQVTKDGIPTEDGTNIKYEGCDDSYKVNEWNATGVSSGFNWYCPAVRFNAWIQIENAAGFTIDWLLKDYEPVDSFGVDKRSNPGDRNVDIEVETQFIATLPDSMSKIYATYSVAPNGVPEVNKNLQLRYEMAGTLLNPTTNSSGQIEETINVSNVVDDTNASDDYSSNGVIVWDPVQEIIGVATVVIDLSVVGIDLVAQEDSIIVTRTRDGEVATLSKSIGYNALPGDELSFSLPAQNRGVLPSPSTEMEIIVPDGDSSRQAVPSIDAYSEQRITIDWIVPEGATIGNQTLTFTVDPDELVVGDANRSNNQATIDVFIGRAPNASITIDTGNYTFEDVFIDARASFDPDGGDVECRFEIESRPGLVDIITTPDCAISWNWSDDGDWELRTVVTDNELDSTVLINNITILNRAPYVNLSHPTETAVESSITIDASDSGDIDTISPSGQQVSISWPDLNCLEGLTQPTCTFTPLEEGTMPIRAIATDDDGAETEVVSSIQVLNVAPIIGEIEVWIAGVNTPFDANGTWVLKEDQTVILRAQGDDTLSDRDGLIIDWNLSDVLENLTVSTDGSASDVATSWPTSGEHIISVRAVDDDGATSSTSLAKVTIENVPPTMTAQANFLNAINRINGLTVSEDEKVEFDVVVDDTASDRDSLEVCWDIDGTRDADLDGTMNNDCDISGSHFEYTWETSVPQFRTVTAWVMDDDGAMASISAVVKVQNQLPSASISYANGSLDNLIEGDTLNLSSAGTSDSESDLVNMLYVWKFEWRGESDLGETGPVISITDLPVGTWDINLTVTDDDLASSTRTITIIVAEPPPEGFLEEFSETLGVSTTMSIVILGLIGLVIMLASFLLITRRSPPELVETPSNKAWDETPLPSYAPAELPAYEQQAAQPAPVVEQPMVNQGPPLPATGLPTGWTMEQWAYYGEQYLAANQAPAPTYQPAPSMTTTPAQNTNLSDLLDDLDL